jgi:hypothetical protein
MNIEQSKYNRSLLKIVVMLLLVFIGLYSTKAVLSDCTIFSRVNCDAQKAELIALEAEISQLKKNISKVQSRISDKKCPKAETPTKTEDKPPKIDSSLWQQGNLEVLNGCWTLDWDYKMQKENTGEIVGVSLWDVCFSASSEIGLQTLLLEDGTKCVDRPIKGEFKNVDGISRLFLDDTKDIKCSSNAIVYQRRIECELRQNGDYAMCSSYTLKRDGSWSGLTPNNIRLSRKKN